jgi:hypothetical protein
LDNLKTVQGNPRKGNPEILIQFPIFQKETCKLVWNTAPRGAVYCKIL